MVDLVDESEFRFFVFAAPTPALPHGGEEYIDYFLSRGSLYKLIKSVVFHINSSPSKERLLWFNRYSVGQYKIAVGQKEFYFFDDLLGFKSG